MMDDNLQTKCSTEHLEDAKRSISESQASSRFSSDTPKKKNCLRRSVSVIAAVSTSPSKRSADQQKLRTSLSPLLPLISPITPQSEPSSPWRSPSDHSDLRPFSPPKKRSKSHSISFPCKLKLPSPVRICSTDQEVVDLTEVDNVQDQPQDLSCTRSAKAGRRSPPPAYPIELQLNVSALGGAQGKENVGEEKNGVKKDREDYVKHGESSSFERLPVINDKNILGKISFMFCCGDKEKQRTFYSYEICSFLYSTD
ncbi:uncharacterized protein LOC135217007 [Macrobrachium nipponense]|uniref:uncharacterized protein LOC135217007 n=1 Tax=Macrobrachium nipponense TaxID=159736 RepID=UPI0030C7A78D